MRYNNEKGLLAFAIEIKLHLEIDYMDVFAYKTVSTCQKGTMQWTALELTLLKFSD